MGISRTIAGAEIHQLHRIGPGIGKASGRPIASEQEAAQRILWGPVTDLGQDLLAGRALTGPPVAEVEPAGECLSQWAQDKEEVPAAIALDPLALQPITVGLPDNAAIVQPVGALNVRAVLAQFETRGTVGPSRIPTAGPVSVGGDCRRDQAKPQYQQSSQSPNDRSPSAHPRTRSGGCCTPPLEAPPDLLQDRPRHHKGKRAAAFP